MGVKRTIGYRDVKAIILRRIQTKEWPVGALSPNEKDLATEFKCARATVNRAMRELAESGLIDRKRKAGSRVSPMPKRRATIDIPLIRTEVETRGKVYGYKLVRRSVCDAPKWLLKKLGLEQTTGVLRLQCIHYADGVPFQFEDRWINTKAIPGVENADFTNIGPNEWLIREVPISDAEFTFYATAASSSLARFLSLSKGDAIFTAERVTWLENQPVTFARMSFTQDYRMTVHSGNRRSG